MRRTLHPETVDCLVSSLLHVSYRFVARTPGLSCQLLPNHLQFISFYIILALCHPTVSPHLWDLEAWVPITGILGIFAAYFTIRKIARKGAMKRKSSIKYKTSEICSRFDISRATLLRWESEGLLAKVERDWRGWRIYTEYNLKNIEKIMKSRRAF